MIHSLPAVLEFTCSRPRHSARTGWFVGRYYLHLYDVFNIAHQNCPLPCLFSVICLRCVLFLCGTAQPLPNKTTHTYTQDYLYIYNTDVLRDSLLICVSVRCTSRQQISLHIAKLDRGGTCFHRYSFGHFVSSRDRSKSLQEHPEEYRGQQKVRSIIRYDREHKCYSNVDSGVTPTYHRDLFGGSSTTRW